MGRQKRNKPHPPSRQARLYPCPIEGLHLRDAQAGDGAAIARLLDEIDAVYDDRDQIIGLVDSGRFSGPWPGLYLALVAESANTHGIAGMCIGVPPGGTLNRFLAMGYPQQLLNSAAQAVVKLKAIAVDPDHRHGGLGRHLVETALTQYAAAGYESVFGQIGSTQKHLADWYRGLGFTVLAPGEQVHLDPSSGITIGPDNTERLVVRALR